MVLDLVLLLLLILSVSACLILKVKEENIYFGIQNTFVCNKVKIIPVLHKVCFENNFLLKETTRGENKDLVSRRSPHLRTVGFFLFKIRNAIIEIYLENYCTN
jgi:hypothetical protein